MPQFLRKEPTQSRSRALVQSLVDAFEELLRVGPDEDKITLEALVRRAGVGIGSFYEWFTNKDALVGLLIAKATRENFETLLAKMDADTSGRVEGLVHTLSDAVAEAYLGHPARTRILISGIGRQKLARMVVRERDRFAHEVALRLSPLLPGEPFDRLERTVRLACDACMGIMSGDLYRRGPLSLAVASEGMFEASMGLLRVRHGFVGR